MACAVCNSSDQYENCQCKVCHSAARAKYNKSEKGKIVRKRYDASPKGKSKNKRQSERLKVTGYHKRYHLEKTYGITESQFNTLLENQNNSCAICGIILEKLNVDHEHSSGRIRGLLCHSCNIGIGLFRDDPKILRLAASYLEENDVNF